MHSKMFKDQNIQGWKALKPPPFTINDDKWDIYRYLKCKYNLLVEIGATFKELKILRFLFFPKE